MALTAADIANQAMQLVGGNNNQAPITGVPPLFDGSVVGIAAGTVYALCVDTITRQFGWDFARAIQDMSLTGNVAPLGWLFEYIFPTNAVELLQVLPADGVGDPNNPVPINWDVGNALGGSVAATGSVTFSSNPSNGQTVTLNGRVFTFVNDASGWPNDHSNYKINIAGSNAGTIFFLFQALSTGTTYLADTALNVATYLQASGTNEVLQITYNTAGAVGNSYTLAASNATPSGAHLAGGVTSQQKVIWTNIATASGAFTTRPPEVTWDANFQQAVVRLLGSFLASSVSSKPETAKAEFDKALGFEKAGETRTDT